MAVLKWEASSPAPDPFEAAVGDSTEYRVHLAECDATVDEDLRAALSDVIEKSLSFASANLSDSATRLLFLWDVVYADLTVVYTDESMMKDAPQVTKCSFEAINEQLEEISDRDETVWEQASEAMSTRIRRMLEDLLTSFDLSMLPPGTPVCYSGEDRGSDPMGFVAHQLIRR